MPQFCPASLRPDATLPFEHTGSLFYLTTIVCQFSPILCTACVTLIRKTSRKEVTNNSCQIKYWPCILLIGSWFNNQSQTFVAWFWKEITQCTDYSVRSATVRSPARTKIFKTSRAAMGSCQPATNEYKRPPYRTSAPKWAAEPALGQAVDLFSSSNARRSIKQRDNSTFTLLGFNVLFVALWLPQHVPWVLAVLAGVSLTWLRTTSLRHTNERKHITHLLQQSAR